jgi:hypothetical protein
LPQMHVDVHCCREFSAGSGFESLMAYISEGPVLEDRPFVVLPQGCCYVNRLTPPGPTSSPTMMSTMPQSI